MGLSNGLVRYQQALYASGPHDVARVLRWFIWAAKDRQCPMCLAPENQPCWSMVKPNLAKPEQDRVFVKWPHAERIDTKKLDEGFKLRKIRISE